MESATTSPAIRGRALACLISTVIFLVLSFGYAFRLNEEVGDLVGWAAANLSSAFLYALVAATIIGILCESLALAAGGATAIIVFFMLGYAVMSWISFFSTGTTPGGLPITVIDTTGASLILLSTLLFLICLIYHSEIKRLWAKAVCTALAFTVLSATIFFILDDYTIRAAEAAKKAAEAPKTVPQEYLSRLSPTDCSFDAEIGANRIRCAIPSAERPTARPEG